MVSPALTVTGTPSSVISTGARSGGGGAAGIRVGRGGGLTTISERGCWGIASGPGTFGLEAGSRSGAMPCVVLLIGACSQHDHPGMPQGRFDGRARRLAEPADGCVAHCLADLAEERQLRVAATVRRLRGEPPERFFLAHRPDPARHALPARLVTEERRDPQQRVDEIRP